MADAPDKPKSKLGDILKFAIFLGIGLFFIYWFLIKLEPEQKQAIWQSFLQANYWWVLLAMAMSLVSHFTRAARWQLLYKTLGYRTNIIHVTGSVIVSYLANLAFPRLGEVVRCVTMRTSEKIPLDKSLGTVATERIVDVLSFLLIVLIGMIFLFGQAKDWLYDTLSAKYETLPNIWMLAGAAVFGLALLFLAYKLFWKKLLRFKLFRKINDFAIGCVDGIKSIIYLSPRDVVLFVFYSVATYALYMLSGYVVCQAFAESAGLPLSVAFVIYLFGTVGMTFSQGGIGVYPVLIQMALAIYDVSDAVGTAAGWLLWGSQQVVVIVLGLAFLVYFSFKKKQLNS
ncbi:MAG: flippase-like domain-containing protein [Bacteroidales bacterium]|nr:flippase-like domain-containing protein [Bacteroidales bacterium]